MIPDVDQIIQNVQGGRIDQLASIRRKLNDLLIVMNALELADGSRDPFHYTKLLFFVDHGAYQNQVHGLNAPFFVYTHGAYSKELDQLHHALWNSGALNSRPDAFAELTEAGRRNLQTANEITGFAASRQFAIIKEVVDEFGAKSGQELLEEHLTAFVKGRTIAALKEAGQFTRELYSGADFLNFASGLDALEDDALVRAFDALAFSETFERESELEFTAMRYESGEAESGGEFVVASES